ncbi:PREDICTED: uncharacterized protein LOC109206760 [Nicotiana attenuata]|uniref:uncharacterized protein LOC109206760 n=1 Tax=Nicotiana attenuata TaxID=49451 RepID=UPI000905D785|nr:PREDICTED: uncharacterized protein LOC109206760 [Nicotiana attenuata]
MEAQNLQKGKRKRDTLSVREYYCYKLQMRNDDEDQILHTGRLLQQYSVDEYIKLETQRLDFVSFNQDLFRMGILQGLLNILRLGERDASNVRKQTFLPNSFIGGPRDMRQCYMDAITLVQRFGKPDLFITMTCNPSWTEIKEHLWSTDEAQNRPDLITRVFRAKIEELKTDILKQNIFGKVVAFMYTVKFQKRGLPHAHFLIILGNEHKLLTVEAYDDIIRAELPDDKAEPDSLYRRRNTGEVVKVREQYLHNSWVVPYNPYLLGKFNCHINVEVCSDIKVVKYLYKYICKGHEKIAFCVQNNNTNIEIDEVKEYRSARWVSPLEAVWRLFGFPISEMSPSVYRLQLHLEGQQFVSFKSNTDIHTIVNNSMIQKTMLTEFFYMNDTDEDAKELNLLYKEFPEYFVSSSSDKFWARRQKRCAVGRIVTCHPIEGERYYLRLLLLHVQGPTSYKDLLTVNGEPCSTFRESVEKRGLLHCDNSLIECMSEATSYQMPYSLRRLFATLLVYCGPANPRKLWERFEESMIEDYKVLQTIERREI